MFDKPAICEESRKEQTAVTRRVERTSFDLPARPWQPALSKNMLIKVCIISTSCKDDLLIIVSTTSKSRKDDWLILVRIKRRSCKDDLLTLLVPAIWAPCPSVETKQSKKQTSITTKHSYSPSFPRYPRAWDLLPWFLRGLCSWWSTTSIRRGAGLLSKRCTLSRRHVICWWAMRNSRQLGR